MIWHEQWGQIRPKVWTDEERPEREREKQLRNQKTNDLKGGGCKISKRVNDKQDWMLQRDKIL